MLQLLVGLALLASPPYQTGVFRLVHAPGQSPGTGCDVYTRLILDNGELVGHVAFLGQRYAGDCSQPIDRAARHYPLFHESTDPCGSEVWNGDFLRGGAYHIRVTDHRPRHCDDQVPAQVVVEETTPDGTTTTLYAAPN